MAKPIRSFPAKIGHWYDRLASYNVADLFTRKRAPGPPRTVYLNQPLPPSNFDRKGKIRRDHIFTSNQIITSKYSLITFLPRNLLEQFRRVANVFFLAIAILQFFHEFATISPGAAILPLIVILVITALKDGYEDFKRHQSDEAVNFSQVRVLSGGDWVNHNATEAKSKSFFPPVFSRRPKHGDPEFDYEGHSNSPEKPHWKQTYWEDLRVGDIVKIMDNQPFPADIVICSTSEEENVAFVETKNLDGETNLKSRHGVAALAGLTDAQQCADPKNQFHIDCERPDTDMYKLNAAVTVENVVSSVDLSHTLLRGTVLKNTDWVIGVVVFTGFDTKILLNSGGTPSKRSKVERQMNPQVFVNLAILAVMAAVCAIVDSSLEKKIFPLDAPWLFSDDHSDDNPKINGLITLVFAFLTFQDIVPISLYISIEVVRTLQAAFIYFDADIYYEKTKQATIARSWNLSDDLGQIEYIFSDKTGTLTQNSMVFRMCSIGGKAYRGDDTPEEEILKVKGNSTDPATVQVDLWAAEQHMSSSSRSQIGDVELQKKTPLGLAEGDRFQDPNLLDDIEKANNSNNSDPAVQSSSLINFFTVLSLCHTALAAIDPETGVVQYKAQSPDEAALVQTAANLGYVFLGKDRDILSLRTPGSANAEKYELLNILEFSSARKRMSVVVRRLDSPTDGLLLLTKGADNVIFERLRPGEEGLKAETERHLSEFAFSGLRTLTLAYRPISVAEYESWSTRYYEANVSLEQREDRIEAVSSELEQNLCLLGATAIEDRLQDGVPETIADLKTAGIKIWVATGDKLETAVAIGKSTNLITPDSNIIVIRGGTRPVDMQMNNALLQFFPESTDESSSLDHKVNEDRTIPLQRVTTGVSLVGVDNGDRPGGFVLVIDGAALLEAFSTDENKALLLRLSILCDGVICCRVSPLQKALIVRLVKDGLGAMTLAIGDGANDVSMIQAADVGVGISGEEGLQAVNSSDYSIAQFRFLKKLLLVHGHWSYARNGVMILNFFYKNIVPTGVLWWFQIFDGWSAAYAFDYTYILFWNSLWTVLPVIGIGLFDRFLDSHTLMAVPELYRYGREGTWFGIRTFMIYVLDGIVQSAVIYFLIQFTYFSSSSRTDGWDIGQFEFSTTMAISSVLVVDLYTGFTATVWTWWLAFAVAFGLVVQWAFTIIYSALGPNTAPTSNLYGNDHFLFRSAYFWLSLPLTFFIALAPRYLYKSWKFIYNPGDLETFQLLQKKYPGRDMSSFSRAKQMDGAARLRPQSVTRRRDSRPSSTVSLEPRRFGRPSGDVRSPNRTDMATGLTSVDRGFDFATEENGVEMRRVQTNLSERRMSKQHLPSGSKGKGAIKNVLSLPKSFLRRKVSSAS